MTGVTFSLRKNFNGDYSIYSPQDLTKLTGNFRFLIIKEVMKSTAKNTKQGGSLKVSLLKK